jgi:hypothetical protein
MGLFDNVELSFFENICINQAFEYLNSTMQIELFQKINNNLSQKFESLLWSEERPHNESL